VKKDQHSSWVTKGGGFSWVFFWGGLAFCLVMWLRNEMLEGSANLCEVAGGIWSL
jgi:hypothetical protein